MTAPNAPQETQPEALPVPVAASAEVVSQIESRESTLHGQIEELVIESPETLQYAVDLLEANTALQKVVDEDLGEPKRIGRKLWESLNDSYNRYMKPLKTDESTLKSKIGTYHSAVEIARTAEIEAAKKQAETNAADEAARDEHVEALVDAGEFEKAEAVLDKKPTVSAPPPAAPAAPTGVSFRETWKAEIFDLPKLIEAAAAGDSNALGILTDDKVKAAATSVASQLAKALKSKTSVPGVKAYAEKTVSKGKK
jgi:hypothetical protein